MEYARQHLHHPCWILQPPMACWQPLRHHQIEHQGFPLQSCSQYECPLEVINSDMQVNRAVKTNIFQDVLPSSQWAPGFRCLVLFSKDSPPYSNNMHVLSDSLLHSTFHHANVEKRDEFRAIIQPQRQVNQPGNGATWRIGCSKFLSTSFDAPALEQ